MASGWAHAPSAATGPTKRVNRDPVGKVNKDFRVSKAYEGYPRTAVLDRISYPVWKLLGWFVGFLTLGGSNGNGYLGQALSYETVVVQTPQYNSTVYVGNLPPNTVREYLTYVNDIL